MKRILLIVVALLVASFAAHAAWKFNPHTNKLDYYESPFDNSSALTAPAYQSSGADNSHFIDVSNSGTLDNAYQSAGRVYVNRGTGIPVVRSSDNTIDRQLWTGGVTASQNFATTGTIAGGVVVLDNVAGPTAAQSYGSINRISTAITVTLPTAVAGMSTCVIDSGTAHDIIVDVQSTDNVVLVGSVGAGGVGITNASGSSTGDIVCLVALEANKWYVTAKTGTWASQ